MRFSGFRLIEILPPTQRGKKYAARIYINGSDRIVHFGSVDYQHYQDQTPLKLWSHLDHNDKKRRDAFYNRHKTNNGPAAQLSKKYLW